MKLRKSLMVAIAMTAASTFLLAGCGTTSSSKSPGTTTQKPTPGGTVNLALPGATNLTWFLPIDNAANDSIYNTQLVDQLYKPLIWVNNDYTINWNSSIASKITYNNAGTVYHVYLNPKWKWSNGQPVTSKDLLFTWNVIKAASAPSAPAPWPFVGNGTGDIPSGIQSVVANGDYEVTITLDKPANQQWFIYNGIIQLVPMPSAAWDVKSNINDEIKYLGQNATNLMFDTVVDGPFMPQSAKANQAWTIVPNPSYAGHKSIVNKIVFNYEATVTAELAALKTGAINLGYLDPSLIGSKPSLVRMGDKFSATYPFGVFWTEMNMWPGAPNKSIFDHLYIRQALQMGIDNPTAAKDVWKGYAVPMYGPVPPLPKTKFLDTTLQNPYPFNIAKATQLLESNGWNMVNGVMTKGSQKLSFTMIYVTGSQSSTDQAELMQQDWAQMGVKVTLKPEQFPTFIGMTSNKKDYSWDLAVGSGWLYNGPGFYPTGGQLFSSWAPSGTGFNDPQEDALINATHQPYATQQETMQHYMAYEDYTAKILPFLWNTNNAGISVEAPNVHDGLNPTYADPADEIPQLQYVWVSSK